jgi:hypothetical protein
MKMNELIEKYKWQIMSLQSKKAHCPNRLEKINMNEFDIKINMYRTFENIAGLASKKDLIKIYKRIVDELTTAFDYKSVEFFEEFGKENSIGIITAINEYIDLIDGIIDDLHNLTTIESMAIVSKVQYN